MKPKIDIDEHLFNNLESFQSIDLEGDWQKVRSRIRFNRKKTMRYYWQTAAAIILLLGMGFMVQKLVSPTPQMLAVEAGNQIKEVVLPDGSSVTLNKQAELTYPEKFNRRHRKLELTGEAYFEVAHNPDQPFIVNVDQKAFVRVLGTSFNISHNKNDESISVQVVEGKVAFSSIQKGAEQIILVKDEQATLRQGYISKREAINMNSLSWKTGKLIFDHTSIGEVCQQLQEYYGVEILLNKSVPGELTFTSTLDNQDLEGVLDEISLVLGLKYSYENGKVVFTKPN